MPYTLHSHSNPHTVQLRLERPQWAILDLSLNPTPYTLHPTPYTLNPTPYTLHPTPYTPNPTP